MVQIVNSMNDYNISNSGIKQEAVQNTIEKSKQAAVDNFESNSIGKVSGSLTDPKNIQQTVLFIPPLYILDKYVDKLIGKGDGKGLFDKIAHFGDKISHALKLDNVISEATGSKISNFIKTNRFTKYFTNEYRAIPKSALAKSGTIADKYSQELMSKLSSIKYNYNYSQLFTQGEQALSAETIKLMEGIGPLKQAITPQYLKSLQKGLPELVKNAKNPEDQKAAIELLKKIFKFIDENEKGISNGSTESLAGEIASVLTRFKNRKVYGDMLVPSVKTLSSDTLKVLSSVGSKEVSSTVKSSQVINAVEDVLSKGVSQTQQKGLLGTKNINLNELLNKLKAADLKTGETSLGKIFAKSALKTKDLLTFGGGFLGLYFAANGLLQTIKATKEAPKGEKKATFMHVLSEQYLGILLFQPSINLLYKAGGNKYRGMTPEARAALKDLLQKSASTKEGYQIAKMQKDLLLRGVNQDEVAKLTGKGLQEAKNLFKSLKNSGTKVKLWEKPLKFAGRILDTGLDNIKLTRSIKFPFKLPVINKNVIQWTKPRLNGFAGGFGRLLIILLVIQPFLQKPITKLFHKIFGEPKTYLEKHGEAKDNKKDKKVENKPENIPENKPENKSQPSDLINNKPESAVYQAAQDAKTALDAGETNLLKKYISQNGNNEQVNASQPITPQKTTDEIAALNLFKKKDENERTYVPSIKVDNSYFDKLEKQQEKEADAFIKQKNKKLKRYLK